MSRPRDLVLPGFTVEEPRPAIVQFYRRVLPSGVVRGIAGLATPGKAAVVSIQHWRDGAPSGRILVFREDAETVQRAVSAARTGAPGRHDAGEMKTSMGDVTIRVWASVSPGERCLLFGRVSSNGSHLGGPTTLALPEEIEALSKALEWLTKQ